MLRFCLAVAFIMSSRWGLSLAGQPEYQVGLYLLQEDREPGLTHICNAVIIHSRLVVTPASCLYEEDSPEAIDPGRLIAEAGSARDKILIAVEEITIAPGYERESGINDLATLKLEQDLPLQNSQEIQWINIGYNHSNSFMCMVNFYEENHSIMQSVEMQMFPEKECNNLSAHHRASDICSEYILPYPVACDVTADLIEYNDDRGTGLVCNNYVYGILSTILPASTSSSTTPNCKVLSLKAYYTSLEAHIGWLFDLITAEEAENARRGTYIIASPYSQKNGLGEIVQQSPVDGVTNVTIAHYEAAVNLTDQFAISRSSSQAPRQLGALLLLSIAAMQIVHLTMTR